MSEITNIQENAEAVEATENEQAQTEDTPSVEELMKRLKAAENENYTLKRNLSKANADVASKKREIRALQTDEQRAASEQKEADEAKDTELAELRRYRDIHESSKGYKEIGFDDETALRMATAFAEHNDEEIKAALNDYISALKTEYDVQSLKNTPRPMASNAKGAMTKEQILAIKDTAERQKMIAANLELFKT